jgi:archaellum component FlaC
LDDLIKFVENSATTHVEIDGVMYPAANVIKPKCSIKLEKKLLAIFKQQKLACATLVKRLSILQERLHLQGLLKANFGSENSKLDPEATKSMEDTFRDNNNDNNDNNDYDDPQDIRMKIEELEDSIETLESEVDFVLSESNSQTHINISKFNTDSNVSK